MMNHEGFTFIEEDSKDRELNYDLINVIKLIMQILPQGNNFTQLYKFSKGVKKSIENGNVILGTKNELDPYELVCYDLYDKKIKE